MPLFIVFEGGEGSGKSTQAKALWKRLLHSGIPGLLIREPGGTGLGKRIRRWLKETGNIHICPISELLLFAASRAELVKEVVYPGLERGLTIVSGRYTDSTLAYQGYGRGLSLDIIRDINAVATQGVYPHLTVLLDIPVQEGLARKRQVRDRFEREELDFHERVRRGYQEIAAAEPERWFVVNALLSRAEIEEIVWQRVTPLIGEGG